MSNLDNTEFFGIERAKLEKQRWELLKRYQADEMTIAEYIEQDSELFRKATGRVTWRERIAPHYKRIGLTLFYAALVYAFITGVIWRINH